MQPKIPFTPLPVPALKRMSGVFRGIGAKISKTMPYIEESLKQANFEIEAEDYCAAMVFLTIAYFVFFSAMGVLLLSKFLPIEDALMLSEQCLYRLKAESRSLTQ